MAHILPDILVHVRGYQLLIRRDDDLGGAPRYTIQARDEDLRNVGTRTTSDFSEAFRLLLYATRRALYGKGSLMLARGVSFLART